MIQGGHDSCGQDVKRCHMKGELGLLCGLAGAPRPGIPQESMIQSGIGVVFVSVCRVSSEPGRVYFIWSYCRLAGGRLAGSSSP